MSSPPIRQSGPIAVRFDEGEVVAQVQLSQIGWKSYAVLAAGGLFLLAAIIFPIWAWRNVKISFPPIVGDDVAATTRNQPVDINVVMNDADPIGLLDLKSVKIEQEPKHGKVTGISELGVVTYVPETDFAGRDLLMYSVRNKDGVRSSLAIAKITINP